MKILLYTEGENLLRKSGLGKAINHQMKALIYNNVKYTRNPNEDYDIAHINWYGPKSYAIAKKAKKNGKKVIYHAHSTEKDFRHSFIFVDQMVPLLKKWICNCYSLGDLIITPTNYSKKLLETYGLKNITVISNGVDTQFFKKDRLSGKIFREKYGFEVTDKVVMAIGLYLERKGILDFVELAKRMPEYKFIWFGYTNLNLVPNKIREAVETKLPNLIFAGYVEQEDIKNALCGADLYIFPTWEETEGIPILEACACKQRIIVRDIPVFEDWLEDNINVYKAKNVDDFEVKIKEVLCGNLKDLTECAYKVALDRDIRKIGEKLLKIYTKILT